jgi:molybdopterin-containing oxidoreductase family iron-sulfur binding subunit
MKTTKKYWKGLAQLNDDPIVEKLAQNEFVEDLPVDQFLGDKKNLSSTNSSRRDFLKFLGFSTAAATLAACETPVVKSIPYLVKPDEIIPGVANYYASTIYDGRDYASVLVKTREGRPIKIENNGTCSNSRVQASVLSLYDSSRLKYPLKNNDESDWRTIDSEIKEKLSSIKNGKIVLLSSTILSPTTKELVKDFSKEYRNVEHLMIDSTPYDGLLDANLESFGVRLAPEYSFDKADVIVSFGADFLANWMANDYATDYVNGRNPKSGKMSKHYQLESNMSLSGANADKRIQIKPSEQAYLLANLLGAIKGESFDKRLTQIVKDLKSSKSKSIVISNSNDKNTQLIVNAINHQLSNYGNTISITNPSKLKQGNTNKIDALISDMQNGKVDALITYNVNPSYSLANSKEFNDALKNVSLKISTSQHHDETAYLMDYVCPDSHNLESWGDANPKHGVFSLMQPTINPLFNTRQFQESLLSWMNKSDYQAFQKNYWISKGVDWNKSLHDGYFNLNESPIKVKRFTDNSTSVAKKNNELIELEIYETVALGDGRQANNPWLQELPDPITRACWDNYLTISASTADKLGLSNWNVANGAMNGSVVNITDGENILENVPVMITPGQAQNTVGMAVGYGRTRAGKAGDNVGFNAYPFLNTKELTITKIEGEYEFASIQLHHTMMGRDIVKETSLAEYIKDPSAGNHRELYHTYKGKLPANEVSLYEEHDLETGHFWNLSIDLTSCIGCGECVISCQAENNIPVVGKEEMRKSRDMHWMRIDRYFSSDMTKELSKEEKISAITMYSEMEVPSENPEVVFQPVMCMHCNHAPCENVCPVAATTHSNEGLNQMTYNRCIGTRYCANNCPYKVRRFNWFQYSENEKFDFHMNDDLGKMVLNPDVVVRSRGVIEKCSMCIQKIQELKLTAKREGRPIRDKDAQTVCASSCSTNALVFGDFNNKESEVSRLRNDERAYDLLDHLNVRPSVFYQTKIRNKA